MDLSRREDLFCKDCLTPSTLGFKKVIDLKTSGLMIYLHKDNNNENQDANKSKANETLILHNCSEKDLRRPDYAIELCQRRSRCFRCINIVKRVRSLLEEVNYIKKNEVIAVCEHCKKSPKSCNKCQYIISKFLENNVDLYKEKEALFKSWLSKLNIFLHKVLNNENMYMSELSTKDYRLELERLLLELKSPLEEPNIITTLITPDMVQRDYMTHGKEMIDEIINKLRSGAWGKGFGDEKLLTSEGKQSIVETDSAIRESDSINTTLNKVTRQQRDKTQEKKEKESKTKKSGDSKEPKKEKQEKTEKESKSNKSGDSKELKKEKESKSKKSSDSKEPIEKSHKGKQGGSELKPSKVTSKTTSKKKGIDYKTSEKFKEVKITKEQISHELFTNLIIQKQKDRTRTRERTREDRPEVGLKTVPVEISSQSNEQLITEDDAKESLSSESFVICGPQEPVLITEMIKGTEIIKYDPNYKDSSHSFNDTTPEPTKDSDPVKTMSGRAGILRYQLSNTEFIKNGYTILPISKVMRHINIYKTVPANPQFNWFVRHIQQRVMFYDTGEILATIEEDGTGKWFYKNGRIALDYHNTEDIMIPRQRYVIYSSGDIDQECKKPVSELASFDTLGNGVVYDLYGKERLKFNQNDGLISDSKIGPVGRWKWNDLNDPPILEPVLIDTYDEPTSYIPDLENNQDKTNKLKDPEMLAIELQHFAKRNVKKTLGDYKSYEIRMKALKINEQFSLRIIDQANIYLLFRQGTVSMKLNMGLMIISTEIIDTERVEMSSESVRI